MPKARVFKWGNSLAVRIPKGVAEDARMEEGDSIVIEASKGRIELRRAQTVPTLEELVAKITPENRYEEMEGARERERDRSTVDPSVPEVGRIRKFGPPRRNSHSCTQ